MTEPHPSQFCRPEAQEDEVPIEDALSGSWTVLLAWHALHGIMCLKPGPQLMAVWEEAAGLSAVGLGW